MDSFDSIFQRAAERKGGTAALEEILPKAASDRTLKGRADSFYLAEMTKCVFRSGFVWQIIEAKWPGFEEAFDGFDVSGCAMLSDEDLERLATDERIVRNAKKIQSVRGNALFVREIRDEHGSFGAWLAAWPRQDFVGLWEELKTRGEPARRADGALLSPLCRLGTRRCFPRMWCKALIGQGVIEKAPTSKKALAAVQAAFNAWHEESGRTYSEISRTLSATI